MSGKRVKRARQLQRLEALAAAEAAEAALPSWTWRDVAGAVAALVSLTALSMLYTGWGVRP